MSIRQLLEKYGYRTISIAMQTAARHVPADPQGAALFHALQEMAMDLESALREWKETHRQE